MAASRFTHARGAAAASAAAKHTRAAVARELRDRHKPPPDPVLGTMGLCWCGEQRGHAWPGKDDGAAHPRRAR